MQRFPAIIFSFLLLASLPFSRARAQSASDIQELLLRASKDLARLGTDPTIVEAVKKHNTLKLSMAEVRRTDTAWVNAPRTSHVVKKITTGELSAYLRKIAPLDNGFAEVLLMGGVGELIAAIGYPDDYWQGDEPKWQRAYAGGKGGTFVDRLQRDAKTRATLAQIAVPVLEEGRAIGALNFEFDIAKYK